MELAYAFISELELYGLMHALLVIVTLNICSRFATVVWKADRLKNALILTILSPLFLKSTFNIIVSMQILTILTQIGLHCVTVEGKTRRCVRVWCASQVTEKVL